MKKYQDYKKNKSNRDLTKEELGNIKWTRFKIIVPTKEDKEELLESFKHIHDSDIDTDFITVNQMAHEYLNGNNILVSEKIYNLLDSKKKSL